MSGPAGNVAAAWAVASAAGAGAAVLVSFGTLAYLLAASPPVGQLLLWSFVAVSHSVVMRMVRSHVAGFGAGSAVGTLGGASLTLVVMPLIPSLDLPAFAVVATAVGASAVGLGQGIALTDGLARRGFLVLLHVGSSVVGATLGAAVAFALGAGLIGNNSASGATLVGAGVVAGCLGGAIYGTFSGWTTAHILGRRPMSTTPQRDRSKATN